MEMCADDYIDDDDVMIKVVPRKWCWLDDDGDDDGHGHDDNLATVKISDDDGHDDGGCDCDACGDDDKC